MAQDKRKRQAPAPEPEPWTPKTALGRKVQAREITDIDEILDQGLVIFEPQIVDELLELESDLLLVGQSRGKFGGGQRRIFKQTQKKTMEGNKPQFTAVAVVGDRNGHIGIGIGKSKETVPAREKAMRKAKMNIFKIRRGAGSWEDASAEPHSIPYKVSGKCGSVVVELLPAPKGKGLVAHAEVQKILALAGVENVWTRTKGQTKHRINLFKAAEQALRQLTATKVHPQHVERSAFQDGAVKRADPVAEGGDE